MAAPVVDVAGAQEGAGLAVARIPGRTRPTVPGALCATNPSSIHRCSQRRTEDFVSGGLKEGTMPLLFATLAL